MFVVGECQRVARLTNDWWHEVHEYVFDSIRTHRNGFHVEWLRRVCYVLVWRTVLKRRRDILFYTERESFVVLLDSRRWLGTGIRPRSGEATSISSALRFASIASSLIGGAVPYIDDDWCCCSTTRSVIVLVAVTGNMVTFCSINHLISQPPKVC